MGITHKSLTSIAILIFLIPTLCMADGGIGVLVHGYPYIIGLLIIVIIIESEVFKKELKSQFKLILKAVSIANIVSTFIGWLAVIFVLPLAALAISSIIHEITLWLSIVLCLSLLVLSYFVSVYMEYWIIEKFYVKNYETWVKIKPLCWKANLYSYLFLLFVFICLTVLSLNL